MGTRLRVLRLLELLLGLLSAVLRRLGEEVVINLAAVNARDVHLGARRNDVRLVHPPHRHAVHAVRPRHQQKPRLQLPQEHHALALEAARQQDHNSPRRDARAQLRRLAHHVLVQRLGLILRSIELGRLGLRGSRLRLRRVHWELAAVRLLQRPQSAPMVVLAPATLNKQKIIF